jgi:hypothetical protein
MENNSKKRGRPSKVLSGCANWKEISQNVWGNGKSNRTMVNRFYFTRAMKACQFGHDTDCLWLANAKADKYRMTILTELGRIDDDCDLLAIAKRLCALKPTANEAVGMIRKFRGVLRASNVDELETALLNTINRWFRRHHGGTWEQVKDAVARVVHDVEVSAAKE